MRFHYQSSHRNSAQQPITFLRDECAYGVRATQAQCLLNARDRGQFSISRRQSGANKDFQPSVKPASLEVVIALRYF